MVAVLLGNAVTLSGVGISDPFDVRSGLSTSVSGALVPGEYTLDPNDGFTAQALAVGAAKDLLSGQVPWWNPYSGLGAPLAAEMQSAALFPGTLLRLMPGGDLLLRVLLEVLAGCATVAVLRRLDVARTVAAVGGVLFALNGVLAWFQHAAALPVAFLPVLVWGLERGWSAARERRLGGYVITALGLSLSLYAGFPETAYLSGLLAAVWFVWRLWGSAGFRWRFTVTTALGGVLGLLLSAPVVLPFAAYVRGGAEVGQHAAGYAQRGLSAGAFGNLFTPYAYGPLTTFSRSDQGGILSHVWADIGGYATIALVALAAIGVSGRFRRGLRLVLGAWVVLAVGKTFEVPVIGQLVGLVPGITMSAFYRYAYASWIFALVVLAALGLDDALRRRLSPLRVVAGTGVAAAALAVAAWEGHSVVERVTDRWAHLFFIVSFGWAALSLVAVAFLLLSARGEGRHVAVRAVGGLLAVEAVVMFAFPTLSAPRTSAIDEQLLSFLRDRAQAARDGTDFGRVYSLTDRLQPDYGTYLGVAQLNVNDLPVPSAWATFVKERLDPNASASHFLARSLAPAQLAASEESFAQHVDGYRAAGVEWVITPPGAVPTPLQGLLEPVLSTPSATVSRLVDTEPYVAAEGCGVQSPSRTEQLVTCSAPSQLVRRELTMPGWEASVDGTSVQVGTYDGFFQAVQVPAGQHTVSFRYVAPGSGAGLALFGVGAVAVLALAGVRIALRARRKAPDPATVPAALTTSPPDTHDVLEQRG